MSVLEQIADYYCPLHEGMVKIRILYDCSHTRLCQINADAAFYECLFGDECPVYRRKNQSCLLYQLCQNDYLIPHLQ